jgi:tRNA(fMet)-specific endonuclease VapC
VAEKMIICIDTSVIIDFYRRKDKSSTFLFKLSTNYNQLAITSITVYEIFSGSNEIQNEFWVKFFINKIILPFDENAAKHAVNIDKNLKMQRKQISVPDLFIAACAIVNNLPLATLNVKHFQRIQGLTLLDKEE